MILENIPSSGRDINSFILAHISFTHILHIFSQNIDAQTAKANKEQKNERLEGFPFLVRYLCPQIKRQMEVSADI